MTDKTPDVLAIYNRILKLLAEELGIRTMKTFDVDALGAKVGEICDIYSKLPKVRTRKKVSPLQKQAMADVAKAADLQ